MSPDIPARQVKGACDSLVSETLRPRCASIRPAIPSPIPGPTRPRRCRPAPASGNRIARFRGPSAIRATRRSQRALIGEHGPTTREASHRQSMKGGNCPGPSQDGPAAAAPPANPLPPGTSLLMNWSAATMIPLAVAASHCRRVAVVLRSTWRSAHSMIPSWGTPR